MAFRRSAALVGGDRKSVIAKTNTKANEKIDSVFKTLFTGTWSAEAVAAAKLHANNGSAQRSQQAALKLLELYRLLTSLYPEDKSDIAMLASADRHTTKGKTNRFGASNTDLADQISVTQKHIIAEMGEVDDYDSPQGPSTGDVSELQQALNLIAQLLAKMMQILPNTGSNKVIKNTNLLPAPIRSGSRRAINRLP